MRNFLYLTTFLSIGLGMTGLLSGLETAAPPSTSSSTKEEQSQMAASLIESAKVANDYVEALDRGQYAQSWTKGDQIFQHTISQDEWTTALNNSRKRLGKAQSRKLKDQRPAKDPKGLPRGAYMVVEYDTSFENAPASGEVLTLRQGTDGKWRVLTYQVN